MKKFILIAIVTVLIVAGLYLLFSQTIYGKKAPIYTSGSLAKPSLVRSLPVYEFSPETYNNPEYSLPLKELPENYQRDVVEKFGKELSAEQKEIFLNNGVVIIPGDKYDRFDKAYSMLSRRDIPIFITSDSILHLYHIEFNEILKNLEINKLSPMLKELLKALITESIKQYNGIKDGELKELVRRNVAYLSVAMKLLDPSYRVPSIVADDVNKEIERIEKHEGFFKSEIFSKDCPPECLKLAFFPNEKCRQDIKGLKIFYQGKYWDSVEFYKEVCTRKCYCEDYSQYIPRGHYTQSDELKRYFKAMMWLGRMSFKVRGESWTKQAILLTDAVKAAKVTYEGKTYPAYEIWNKIYSVTGFFAGASDDLTFYDYDEAVNKILGYKFNEEEKLKLNLASDIQEEISKMRPKILGGFEIDLAGNLKDLTQGLRFIGQRYALDSQILGDLVYKNVGPNPNSPYYDEVIDYCTRTSCAGPPVCSKPKEFYYSCQNLEENRTKYWNEVCDAAVELYCGCPPQCDKTSSKNIEKLFSVCRFMPTGLDVANVLGSKEAEDILKQYYECGYCNYDEKVKYLKNLTNSYSQEKWTQNLYNTWLWMLQPVLREKAEGYPNWMRSEVWRLKDLITFLSSWAELRHDTILYVKQSYTWAVGVTKTAVPMEARYYGYVEPNPELFARAKFAVDFLNKGLKEQGVITEEVEKSLRKTSTIMERLENISKKELRGESLTEDDYNYIRNIDSTFNSILEDLASALTIKEGTPVPGSEEKTSLEGKDEAFKTPLIADVHTDSNSKRVLEVGTGKVDWILVAHKSKEGRIGIAIGPIFSYYEFSWPMKDRLTDEKWRNEVLPSMERPIWYDISKVRPASMPYIIK